MNKKDLRIVLCDLKNYVEEVLENKYPERESEWMFLNAELVALFAMGNKVKLIHIERLKERYEIEGFRLCKKCGKFIREGYTTPDGDNYCSPKCLGMTEKEIKEQYSDEDDCVFWTEWED